MATGQPSAARRGPTGEHLLISVVGRVALVVAVAGATSWPGGDAQVADRADALGQNVSGLAVAVDDGAGTPVLWAVRDDPGEVIRLVADGDRFVIDEAWRGARRLTWPDGRGEPDAEAVAVAGDRADVVYVAAERDNDDAGTPRPSVLELSVGSAAPDRIVATRSWDLTSLLPSLDDANTGVEGLAWVPDLALVEAGFVDDAGRPYDPARHPGHGTGLFVTALEDGGRLDVFALGDAGADHIATAATGLSAVMDLTWDVARGVLWAVCDDHCDGRMVQLAVSDGSFEVVETFDPPHGLEHRNDEGFAIGPCIDGVSGAVWADDDAHDDHVLRTAELPCSSSDPAAGRAAAAGSDGSSAGTRVAVATGAAAGAAAAAIGVQRQRRRRRRATR